MASSAGTGGPATTARPTDRDYVEAEASNGYGWVLFGGTMVGLVGILNIIYGIAAIDDSRFYARGVEYVISDLNTWGWFLLVVGVIQVLAAIGIWMRTPGARWVGILTAAVNAIIQMLIIRAFPVWAMAIFAVDVLIIYGLLSYGRAPART